MGLIKKTMMFDIGHESSLKEIADQRKVSVSEIVRLAIFEFINRDHIEDIAKISKREISQLARHEEQILMQMRKELLADLQAGLSAFNEMSELHIERSTQLTRAFVESLSDALNGEMVSAPQETKPAKHSNMDIMLELERQKQQRQSKKPNPNIS